MFNEGCVDSREQLVRKYSVPLIKVIFKTLNYNIL